MEFKIRREKQIYFQFKSKTKKKKKLYQKVHVRNASIHSITLEVKKKKKETIEGKNPVGCLFERRGREGDKTPKAFFVGS